MEQRLQIPITVYKEKNQINRQSIRQRQTYNFRILTNAAQIFETCTNCKVKMNVKCDLFMCLL